MNEISTARNASINAGGEKVGRDIILPNRLRFGE